MPRPATTDNVEILQRFRQQGTHWQRERDAVDRQLDELQLLLRQTATELDRLSPRSNQASQRVRDMEAHIESYARTDIKDIYAAAQETQMRLFMMQLQQEQIEHKRRTLGSYREFLVQGIAMADRIAPDETDSEADTEEGETTVSPAESIARAIQAQEDERRRVSRRIHDGPAQALANLVLRAEICERLMESDQVLARNELLSLKKLVTDSLQDMRRFIFELRPMILDDLGLAATLRHYCEMLTESGGVPVRLSVSGGERRLDTIVETAIFRVVQETIRNALAHGQPGEVRVLLETEADELRLTVQDDGRGCDGTAVLAAARQGQTMGLAHIEQYVCSLGGDFKLESIPARGCTVNVSVPLGSLGMK